MSDWSVVKDDESEWSVVTEKPKKSISDFITNQFPSSAGRAIGGVSQAVLNPIQTAKGIGSLALGFGEKFDPILGLGKKVGIIPSEMSHEKYANTFIDDYKKRYGNIESILNTMYEDPVGVGLDALAVAEPWTKLGTGAVLKGTEAASKTGLVRKMTAPSGALERLGAQKAGIKSRTSVSKLLPSADISSDIAKGQPIGVQVEGQKIITKTSDPMRIVDKFRSERADVIKQVDDLVAQNNKPINPRVVVSRAKLLLNKQIKNSSPSDRVKIGRAFKDEINFIKEQGDLDGVKANARKRFLYEETQNMQKKQAQGKTVVLRPEKDLVKDAFAQAYKESVEGLHPDIQKLNSRFAGLDEGVKASAKLAESSMEQGSAQERIATQIIGRPSVQSGIAAGVRELPFIRKSVSKLSGDVEKYANKAEDLLIKSRLKQAPRLMEGFLKQQKQKMSNREYFGSQLTDRDTLSLLDKLTGGS